MTRIFISHSAKDDFAKKVRQRLKAKLKDIGLEPLVDEDLIAGDTWRAKLHYWLGCCEGAILLFSEDALLRSEWVKKEATILSWRKFLHPGLVLVPVRLGDVSAQELKNGYLGSLELGELQAVCCHQEDDNALDRLIENIVRPFRGLPLDRADPGFGDWVEQVAMRLGSSHSRGLVNAAQVLDIEEEEWKGFGDPVNVLAHHVLHLGLVPQVLDALGKAMDWISSQEHRRDLLKWLWFLWVREEAARQIIPVTQYAEEERLLAINASEQDSGRCYIRRATCSSNDTLILGVTGISGEAAAVEIVNAFDKSIRHATGLSRASGPESEEALLGYLRMARVFFLLRKDEMRRDVLDALRERFPMVTLVLLSGRAFPDKEELGAPGLVLIQPSLEEGEEGQAMARIAHLQGLAKVRDSDWRDE